MSNTKLCFALMDAPFENTRTTTAFRLLEIAARKGCELQVFAYEGAVSLAFAQQAKHANAVHGNDIEEEDHPLSREWITEIEKVARNNGGSLVWINCGLCVDERGVNDAIALAGRGTPADLLNMAAAANNTLIIATS